MQARSLEALVAQGRRRLAKEAAERAAGVAESKSFARMGTKLDKWKREQAEERYVTAFYGIKTSWRAIERAGLYSLWRRGDSLRIRPWVRPAFPLKQAA